MVPRADRVCKALSGLLDLGGLLWREINGSIEFVPEHHQVPGSEESFGLVALHLRQPDPLQVGQAVNRARIVDQHEGVCAAVV